MKALIIDDEHEICTLVAYQLQKLGIASSKAHTLSDGLKIFTPGEHNVVFLDVNLPDGSGLDIIADLKALDSTLKIILISAYDIKSEYGNVSDLGVYQFLGKPFSKKMIADVMSGI